MTINKYQIWFTSNKFKIIPGEDSETNPLCYGRQLAEWLCSSLTKLGYESAEVIPEDWGWCVLCFNKPFLLWVGCVSVHDYSTTKPSDPLPNSKDVIWTCTVVAEQSFLSRLFRRTDTSNSINNLFRQLQDLLTDANVSFVDEP